MPFGECFLQREAPWGLSAETAVSMRRRILFAGLDWGRNQDPSGTQLVPPTCLERVTCLLVSVFCRERPLGVSHRNGRLTAVSMRRRILFAGLDWGRNQDPSGTQLVPPTCLERVTCLLVSVFCRERPLGVSHRNVRFDEKENPLCRTRLGTEPRPKRDSVGPTNMFGACDMPFGECFLQREAPWGLSSKRPFDGRFDEKENPLCRTGLGTEPRPKRDSVGPTNMFGACDMPFGECFLQREAPWGLSSKRRFPFR